MGTSVVINTLHHSLIYDFGPGNGDGYSLGEWVVQPFLRHQGIKKPDRIVISHADQDHAGGFFAIQDEFKGVPVYTGTPVEVTQKFPAMEGLRNCHRTSSWVWDGIEFEFLTAPFEPSASENNRSCVLKISQSDHFILIAGDIEKKQEQALLNARPVDLRADVMVAPHHGSLTSSSVPFIHAVAPAHVIFTSGYLNRWKFPRPEVVQRYLKFGSRVYQTYQEGAIELKCAQDGCSQAGYREQHQRIWY
jgi:competence protein ComEC